jgi:hypothetical protein
VRIFHHKELSAAALTVKIKEEAKWWIFARARQLEQLINPGHVTMPLRFLFKKLRAKVMTKLTPGSGQPMSSALHPSE